MNEKRRQALLGYRDSLSVAYIISIFMLPITLQYGWLRAGAIFVVGGLVFGSCFFALAVVRKSIRVPSFSLNILAQTIATLLTILFASLVAFICGAIIYALPNSPNPKFFSESFKLIQPGPALLILLGGTVLAGFVNGLFAINRKLGPGVMLNWLTGKYYKPRQEERIFMFLDLNDSTTLAEQLGNLKFSALIRDFFTDLTYPVLETRAEVSHYVGDEAVITWKVADGLKDANCIMLFFKMRDSIEQRSEFYIAQYGFVPKFKAGVHVGPVVATEVGEVKSEIVFHGDVLNTAARIQGLCNQEGCPLLVSADCAQELSLPSNLKLRSIGLRSLKRKAAELEIYTVERF